MMKHLKIGFAVLFVLLVSFFVVKSCVHPKKIANSTEEFTTNASLVSKTASAGHPIVMAPRPLPKSNAVKAPAANLKSPHMAIILDDWGKNYGVLKYALDIHRPLTVAIIPNLIYSKKIAEAAHQNGLGVMLHLPMEPKNKAEPLEPHTIMTNTPDSEVMKDLDLALEGIPFVEGANNHMGSAATSDARVMRLVLSDLKSKNLFFIDSHVTTTTQGPKVAKEVGVLFSERDVFIDNENNMVSIKYQLERARKIALKHGEVIVIGHDRKLTLLAIKEMLPALDASGVKLVYAREVVKVTN